MPKPDKEVIIFGEQQADIEVVSVARVIVGFVRQQCAMLNNTQPATDPPRTSSDGQAA